jgi:hypothetical protein
MGGGLAHQLDLENEARRALIGLAPSHLAPLPLRAAGPFFRYECPVALHASYSATKLVPGEVVE